MFPYLRTAREFIDDCTVPKYLLKESKGKYIITCNDCVGDKIQCNYIDNGNKDGYKDDYKCCGNCISSRLVGWLIQRVNNSNWGSEVTKSEAYAWCNSLGIYMKKLLDVLSDKYKDNLLVGLENYLEREKNGRSDVMIIGQDKNGKGLALIIELKQWSGIVKKDSKSDDNCEVENVKKDNEWDRKKLPTLQVKEYKENLSKNNDAFTKKEITIEHAIYMHNLDKNNDKIPLTDNKYDVKVFYKGQELLLKEYIEELFPEDKQSLEKAKITVQNIRNGYQTLDARNVAEIILGKQNGKDYLRSDQRFVFGKIQERINKKDKTIDIIYGVPGSGKTLIAACLVNYILYEKKYCLDFTCGCLASINAVKEEIKKINPNWNKSIFKSFEEIKNEKKVIGNKVIIIDEAHAAFLKEDDYIDYLSTANHIIILGDILQRLRPDEGLYMQNTSNCIMRYKLKDKPRLKSYDVCDKYNLWTQFRCNADDGYISWIDQVLQIEDVNSIEVKINPQLSGQGDGDEIYISDLDFQPRIIEKDEILDVLENNQDGKMIIATGDWIKDEKGKTELKSIFDGKRIDYSYINEQSKYGLLPAYTGNTVYIGNANCVQGVEKEKALIIIGNEITGTLKTVSKGSDTLYWSKRLYRVLLTRAMKECYIYVVDKGLRERFRHYTWRCSNR